LNPKFSPLVPPECFIYRIPVSGITYDIAFVDGDWSINIPLVFQGDTAIALFVNSRNGKGDELFKGHRDSWFSMKALILLAIACKRTGSTGEREKFFLENINSVFEHNPFRTIAEYDVEMGALKELDWPVKPIPDDVAQRFRNWMQNPGSPRRKASP
jgi:hypothetical protein